MMLLLSKSHDYIVATQYIFNTSGLKKKGKLDI